MALSTGSGCVSVYAQTANEERAVNLIFDTDIGPDYDDVGAMSVLHSLADSGQVRILATVASNQSPYIAAVLSVMNTYFKRPDLPIGVVRGRGVRLQAWQKWDSLLVARYPHSLSSNAEAEDALSLYRRTLSQQPDQSVTIVTVGFLTNLADLLLSGPDQFSDLSGRELIRKKVKKLVSMAGRFPSGKEFNVDRDPVSSKIVFEGWNTPIIFSGFEIGEAIHTGLPLMRNEAIRNSPVKDAFAISIPLSKQDVAGRMSWDQTAVLVAIKGHEKYFDLVEGRFVCKDDGSNTWNSAGKGHFYLVQKMPVAKLERIIEDLMNR
ncbi:nucleoside hydrolase [Arundinibacter roseus]|uniref:Nucleoside hydrolase n=1 Tax=Arundinibacter roseus TaxID=2070510 RepID=A0A4R4KL61_9BACT|nr:nucleoside hydrolase [Arundinibacter roseus]TDB69074.1 nucleoside hydrolase [Arundinibacter roseus]